MAPGELVTPERWQQVKTILEQALDKQPGERTVFVTAACADDSELREEVESLLAVEADSEDFIETPLVRFNISEPPLEPLALGERVGAYRILREIGRGGMGSVYLAARADEAYEKQVAIKVIRRGMDTEEVVRRFRSERQILAKLDHPNIARLLDGGATEDGRPYFVLEHVEGRPIDEYCEAERLSLRERLDLMLDICSAVQLAHQNLVVHRDLKPGNILVTADGTPKLLDFGIAKLLDPAAQEVTQLGVRPMTPEYASPEQVKGEPVTTASDVYSLGVLLYVLLTGRSPYEPPATDREAIARAIREETPPKPSTAAVRPGKAVRRLPESDPKVLRKHLSGDLDNIILMAMRKEPERRYSSVEALANDLRRYLDRMPVVASGDTWRYRAGKFVKRHRVGVLVTTLVALVLVGSSISMTLLWRQAVRERDRAEAVSDFLEKLFEIPDPSESRGEKITAREVLDRGAQTIQTDLKGQPELQADLMETIGRVYRSLGLSGRARPFLVQTVELRRATLGRDNLKVADGLQNLAAVLRELGEMGKAEAYLREALKIQHKRGVEETSEYAANLNNLASLLEEQNKLEEAEELYRQAMEIKKRLLGTEHEDIAKGFNNLGTLLHKKGDLDAAEEHYRRALEMRRRLLGDDHPEVTSSMNNLAVFLEDKGDLAAAEELYRELLAIRRRLYPEPHPKVALALHNLGALLLVQGDGRTAERLYQEALAIAGETLPADHWNRAVFLKGLAASMLAQGRSAEAEPPAREALEIFRHSEVPPERVADAESLLGGCLAAQGRFAEAEPLLLRAYESLQGDSGGARYLRAARDRVIDLYTAWGKPDRLATFKASLH
jgi:eukaryotic-like serine/threonine-protein kinase